MDDHSRGKEPGNIRKNLAGWVAACMPLVTIGKWLNARGYWGK